jgi:hypothetical protein
VHRAGPPRRVQHAGQRRLRRVGEREDGAALGRAAAGDAWQVVGPPGRRGGGDDDQLAGRRLAQLVHRALGDGTPGADDADAVAEPLDELELVGREHHRRAGIAALAQDLGDRMADTIILTMSEFGRAVAENGNRGTDHGHGNAMMLIGGGVKGGAIYGDWPGLGVEQRFEGRDLQITTDFRDVFGEVVMRHLGADEKTAAKVFPGYGVKPTAFRNLIKT